MVNLSALDLNLLWTLHVVLEEKTVARAARRLGVTPPAVSNALARLRDVLGDPLFVRHGRGLVPTPRTLELKPALERTFTGLEGALRPPFDPAETTRTFTIALTDADQVAGLPHLARRFAQAFPRARLNVVSVDTLISVGGLGGETVDLAIGPRTDDPELRFAELYVEEAVFVASRRHPRLRRRLTRAQFLAERHVDIHLALGRGGRGHRVAEDAFARAGLTRDIAVTVPTFTAAVMVAASTTLVAGVPRRLAMALRGAARAQILEGPAVPLRFSIGMAWHERTHGDPAATAFREVAKEALSGGPG